MTTIWNDLLNLFFPNLCRVCRKPLIEGEKQICLRCLCDLPRAGYHRPEEDNPAEQLFAGNIHVTHANAFLRYEIGGSVQKLVHSLKYHDNKELGYILGRQAAIELKNAGSRLCGADLLIPVPLHPRKQRKRGYNQSEWIAQGIRSAWNIPINTSALSRTQSTDTQTRKTIYNRWINVKDVFAVSRPDELRGKHILLIDDVITTGSTISGCIEALAAVPELQISVFSISIV